MPEVSSFLHERIFVLILMVLMLLSCQAAEPLQRDCQIEHLLILETDLPGKAEAGEIISPLPGAPGDFMFPPSDASISSAGNTFYSEKGIVNQLVYRFTSPARAVREIDDQKRWRYATTQWVGPWRTPLNWTYESPIADQSYTACGQLDGTDNCKTIAQYEEYYVYFQANVAPDGWLSLQEYARALQAIDGRFATCLGANNEN